jgi:hypothetical protein
MVELDIPAAFEFTKVRMPIEIIGQARLRMLLEHCVATGGKQNHRRLLDAMPTSVYALEDAASQLFLWRRTAVAATTFHAGGHLRTAHCGCWHLRPAIE